MTETNADAFPWATKANHIICIRNELFCKIISHVRNRRRGGWCQMSDDVNKKSPSTDESELLKK